MELKTLKTLFAAIGLLALSAVQPSDAAVSLLTGPLDPSNLLGTLNQLIVNLNTQIAPLGTSPRTFAACGAVGLVNNTATANAAATDVYITELFVPAAVNTTGVAVLNGTTAANSSTIYLTDVAGNQLAHTASTAVSGTSQYQLIPWTAVTSITPGTYYLYFTNSGTTNTWETINNAACGTALVTGATYGTFKATTPPTTFTTAQGPIGSLY